MRWTLYLQKNKVAFTRHMKAPHVNQKWALAFVAERYFLNFLVQSIKLPNTAADAIYTRSLANFKDFLETTAL